MAACAADDESGERSRFSCLAALRYTVATVVTVLAAVVIVMVINVVVLRPEEFVLSVVQGHVRTSNLYTESDDFPVSQVNTGTAPSLLVGAAASSSTSTCDDNSIIIGNGPSSNFASVKRGRRRPPQQAQVSCLQATHTSAYGPVSFLDLTVILRVDNPSGRGEITCDSMEVRFFDMPYYYSGDGNTSVGMEIDRFDKNQSFLVQPQSSHRFWKALRVINATVLQHIADAYGGRSGFDGKVNGTLTITSSTVIKSTRKVDFDCSPVDFGVSDAAAAAAPVVCKPTKITKVEPPKSPPPPPAHP